jgi:hypothetical protein
LSGNPRCVEAFAYDGVAPALIEYGLAHSGEGAAESVLLISMSLLAEVWVVLPDAMNPLADACKELLNLLRTNSRAPSRACQVTALSCLFSLLDALTESRSRFAPFVFKALIFALVAHTHTHTHTHTYTHTHTHRWSPRTTITSVPTSLPTCAPLWGTTACFRCK